MPTLRWLPTHVVLSGRIFLMGGWNDQKENVNSVECYDPLTDQWETVAPMRNRRHGAAACVSGGFIYVFGGTRRLGLLQSIERYDPMEDSWTEVSYMLTLI